MFVRSVVPPQSPTAPPLELLFVANRLVIEEGEGRARPADLARLAAPADSPAAGAADPVEHHEAGDDSETLRRLYLGTYDGRPCYVRELARGDLPIASDAPAWTPPAATDSTAGRHAAPHAPGASVRMVLRDLRSLMGLLDEELWRVAGTALQFLDWDRNHQFCGRCGGPTTASETDRSRSCPRCSLHFYPRISPAIIVGIHRAGRILLARNRRYRGPHPLYSVLAGFVEPGESLEECVRREVVEEVSLELGEIRYFASQPWPFPDSLMVGFTAEYGAGEIRVDGEEILDADWFDRDTLPAIPPQGTIARRIIDSLV